MAKKGREGRKDGKGGARKERRREKVDGMEREMQEIVALALWLRAEEINSGKKCLKQEHLS